jgi:hypothetical protein
LSFVPSAYMGADPSAVKAGLRQAYARLTEDRAIEHLLLAHGQPWIGGGAAALRDFVSG